LAFTSCKIAQMDDILVETCQEQSSVSDHDSADNSFFRLTFLFDTSRTPIPELNKAVTLVFSNEMSIW
jgi:hypothetical protein